MQITKLNPNANGYPYFGSVKSDSGIVVLFVSENTGICVEDKDNQFGYSNGTNEWIGTYYWNYSEENFNRLENYECKLFVKGN